MTMLRDGVDWLFDQVKAQEATTPMTLELRNGVTIKIDHVIAANRPRRVEADRTTGLRVANMVMVVTVKKSDLPKTVGKSQLLNATGAIGGKEHMIAQATEYPENWELTLTDTAVTEHTRPNYRGRL